MGFLLGGIGEINKNRQPNFFVVDKRKRIFYLNSERNCLNVTLFVIIDLCDGCAHRTYCFTDTSVSEIEETFKKFLRRDDIDIILISQNVSHFPRPSAQCF